MSLHLDWCSHKAAKYAVQNWHYSKTMPTGKTVKIGVWENGKFIGVIIFGRGANRNFARPYGLGQDECCELTRIALRDHQAPVSQMLAKSFKLLKKHSPKIRLIISYADPYHGHYGGIYQANNWIYVGTSAAMARIKLKGKLVHRKSVYVAYGRDDIPWLRANVDPKAEKVKLPAKHKYLMPLDKKMRKKVETLRKPYPKDA